MSVSVNNVSAPLDALPPTPPPYSECNAEFVYECRRVTSGEDCEAGGSACAQCTFDSLLCHDAPTQLAKVCACVLCVSGV